MKKARRVHAGFTIIEVLIVFAIAAFILLVVFLVVPKVKQVLRDIERKRAVTYALSQMEQFKVDHNNQMPITPTGDVDNALLTEFMNNYLTEVFKDKFGLIFINYNTAGYGHSYIPPMDNIAMVTGHYCNNRPGVQSTDIPSNPITGNHSDVKDVVAWTPLEAGTVFCVDNSDGLLRNGTSR